MNFSMDQVALGLFLKAKNSAYYWKLNELRDEITKWLSYVPQTFPHYTSHTIDHSDEIFSQISKLLFRDESAASPIVDLSPIEAYVLGAAAYLHDAGMVVSAMQRFFCKFCFVQ